MWPCWCASLFASCCAAGARLVPASATRCTHSAVDWAAPLHASRRDSGTNICHTCTGVTQSSAWRRDSPYCSVVRRALAHRPGRWRRGAVFRGDVLFGALFLFLLLEAFRKLAEEWQSHALAQLLPASRKSGFVQLNIPSTKSAAVETHQGRERAHLLTQKSSYFSDSSAGASCSCSARPTAESHTVASEQSNSANAA